MEKKTLIEFGEKFFKETKFEGITVKAQGTAWNFHSKSAKIGNMSVWTKAGSEKDPCIYINDYENNVTFRISFDESKGTVNYDFSYFSMTVQGILDALFFN